MTTVAETVLSIVGTAGWDERVEAVRRIPERHGKQEQQAVYSAVAEQLYRPHLSANFAFVPRREHYELETFPGPTSVWSQRPIGSGRWVSRSSPPCWKSTRRR